MKTKNKTLNKVTQLSCKLTTPELQKRKATILLFIDALPKDIGF